MPKAKKAAKSRPRPRAPTPCPSCGGPLAKVGYVKATREVVSLCHNERKAFRGTRLFTSDRARHPDMYVALTPPLHEPTLNIEDVVLTPD